MRPIDADALSTILSKTINNSSNELTTSVLTLFKDEIVAAMPTICNLDAMKQDLEEKIKKCDREMLIAANSTDVDSGHIYDEFYNKKKAYEDALAIICSNIAT